MSAGFLRLSTAHAGACEMFLTAPSSGFGHNVNMGLASQGFKTFGAGKCSSETDDLALTTSQKET